MRWLHAKGSRFLLFARQQTRTEADAKDVFQDAVLKIWKRFEQEGAAKSEHPILPQDAQMYVAIRQCAVDLARKESRRILRETKMLSWEDDRNLNWFCPDSGSEEYFETAKSSLMSLEAKYQEVLTLKIWGQLTFARIGEVLGIPANTAASRYRYGLQALRKKMKVQSI